MRSEVLRAAWISRVFRSSPHWRARNGGTCAAPAKTSHEVLIAVFEKARRIISLPPRSAHPRQIRAPEPRTYVTIALSRSEDRACLQLHSRDKFDAVARGERRRNLPTGVASVTGTPESTTQRGLYEVRECCEGGGRRGSGDWIGSVSGP